MGALTGFVGIKVNDMISNQRFDNSVTSSLHKLQQGRMLAFELSADMTLTFSKCSKGLLLSYATEAPYTKKESLLEGISSLSFEGDEQEKLSLVFDSKGQVLPKGHLDFYKDPHLKGKKMTLLIDSNLKAIS